MVALQAPSKRVEDADARQDRLGNAVELERQRGDDAERALGADKQAREVVAGRRLPRPAAGGDDAAVGQHRGQPEHEVAHGAVTHGVGARGPGRRHAAEARVGPGVDGKEQAGAPQIVVEGFAGHAGLHDAVEIGLVHGEDVVHAGKIERQAATRRVEMSFERRSSTERDHRHPGRGTRFDDLGDLFGGLGEQNGVGGLRLQPGQRAGVLLAQRLAPREAVAEARGERGEQRFLRPLARARFRPCHDRGHGSYSIGASSGKWRTFALAIRAARPRSPPRSGSWRP